MRTLRTLTLAGLAALVVSGTALACPGTETRVSGSFDASGHFVVAGAWDKDGKTIDHTKGITLASYTTTDNLVVPASTLAGKTVCLWGNLDVSHKTMSVSGYKECTGTCDGSACPSMAAAAGAGHCAAKGASAAAAGAGSCAAGAAKGADAAAASAGGCCASKGASAAAASAAPAAGGCCASGAAAKTASASSCETKGASKTASAHMLVYKVSGMTCGGCASKVQGAVSKMANVSGCTVDLEKAQAVVTTSGDVDAAAIGKAITAAGFPAELTPAETTRS